MLLLNILNLLIKSHLCWLNSFFWLTINNNTQNVCLHQTANFGLVKAFIWCLKICCPMVPPFSCQVEPKILRTAYRL